MDRRASPHPSKPVAVVGSQVSSITATAAEARVAIDVALRACLRLDGACPPRLLEAMRYSLLAPGKRLRPLLALWGAEACGGSSEKAMPAACAVEMIHAYSLIHDDLPAMDDDDLRRGQPTCHRRFDEATAILAGDALLTLAFETLARQVRPASLAARCTAALARAAGCCRLVGGQADDIAAENAAAAAHPQAALDWLESIHRRKTGALILVALHLGGLTAGAHGGQLHALKRYGKALGLAFQITDDLLDVRGSEAAVGKRVGKDAARGKLTFPALMGADTSARRAEALVEDACAALAPLGPAAAKLQALARYVAQRQT